MTMMSLGMFAFGLPTLAYAKLQRRQDWRHVRQTRVGARDANQYVGPGEDTITLDGVAMAALQPAGASLDELRRMAATGDCWSLIDGAGRVYGAFVILTIDEGQSEFFADGTPRKIDFSINLLAVDGPAPRDAG
jgi:phage protein U